MSYLYQTLISTVKFIQKSLTRDNKKIIHKNPALSFATQKYKRQNGKLTANKRKASTKALKDSKKRKGEPYSISRPQKKEFRDILQLMHKSYYDDEPTVASVCVKPNHIFDKISLDILHRGYSLVAKSKYDQRIVGASLNIPLCPCEPQDTHKLACSIDDKDIRSVLHYYALLYEIANVWKVYDVPSIFDISYLFIDPMLRNRKIGLNLLAASRNFAGDCGFKVARVDATSYYSAKICEKLNMKLIYTLPYKNFVDEQQQPIFRTSSPHDATRVYVDNCLHETRGYPKMDDPCL